MNVFMIFRKEKATKANPEPNEDYVLIGQTGSPDKALEIAVDSNRSEFKNMSNNKRIIHGNRENTEIITKTEFKDAKNQLIDEWHQKQKSGQIPD